MEGGIASEVNSRSFLAASPSASCRVVRVFGVSGVSGVLVFFILLSYFVFRVVSNHSFQKFDSSNFIAASMTLIGTGSVLSFESVATPSISAQASDAL